MRQTKRERRKHIRQRAEEMARSGEYDRWEPIELELRGEGYHEARGELDSKFLRDHLNALCVQARAQRIKGMGPPAEK